MKPVEHTPGPWQVAKKSFRRVTSATGVVICNAVLRNSGSALRGHRHGAKELLEAEANARLIGAAPDLLADLEKAADWFDEYADEHYRKALNAPSFAEQGAREDKGKRNRERANELRETIAEARGAA